MPLEIECLKFPSGDLTGRIVPPSFFFPVNKKDKNTKNDFYEFATFMNPHSTNKTKEKRHRK